MQMLYNSDSFAVVGFDIPASTADAERGGCEIVGKMSRMEIHAARPARRGQHTPTAAAAACRLKLASAGSISPHGLYFW